MRAVNDYVSQMSNGTYSVFWCGDELALNATNDADAIAEGAALLAELESEG